MSKEVANKNSGAVAALSKMKQGLANVRNAIPSPTTAPILRLVAGGVWVYGQENIEVEKGSLWAVNPMSIQHGYVCWTNKEKGEGKNDILGEVYAPMLSDPIDPKSLPDHGWPWKAATSMQLKCVSGEDKGEEIVYKPSSVGGANFMHDLINAIEDQLDTGTDDVVPVIELTHDHYIHKQFGRTYTPEFRIEKWVGMDGVETEEPEDEVEEPKAKPKKKAEKQETKKPKPRDAKEVIEDEVEDAEVIEDEEAVEEPKTEGRTRRRRRAD